MIHRALRMLRVYHNSKQKDLAEKLGLSPSHLSEIEKGIKPVSYDLLERYAKVYNIPVSSITLFAEAAETTSRSRFKNFATDKALKLLEWLDLHSSESQDEHSHQIHRP